MISEGDKTAPNDGDALDPVADLARIERRRLNKTGCSESMALCANAKRTFLLVKKAHTTELPNGSLFEAWKNLKVRCEPTGIASAEDTIDEHRDCKLEPNQDPEEWIATKDEI